MKCKLLKIWRHIGDKSPRIILGVVIEDTDNFLKFKSGAGKVYLLNKHNEFFSVVDSNIDYTEKRGVE